MKLQLRKVCGTPPAAHSKRAPSNKGANYWARKSGQRPPLVFDSLLKLEAKLASI